MSHVPLLLNKGRGVGFIMFTSTCNRVHAIPDWKWSWDYGIDRG